MKLKAMKEVVEQTYPYLYEMGEDWGSPRKKIYIEAILAQAIETNKTLAEELKFEQEVNKRIHGIFSARLGRAI